ncbi:hypothetical protein [Deinococcus misasensis]|uniref:hypothetical protein n=1 Tax=Deinococcus misasensis TaxID=392413 RepID=UPI000554320A|nr:hypothetical protein [Deinococcus misasensis]
MAFSDMYELLFSKKFAHLLLHKEFGMGEVFEIPYYPYGSVPGMIPLMSWMGIGPVYYALWIPWYSDRTPYFVVSHLCESYKVKRIANTEEEFIKYLLFEMLDLGINFDILENLANNFGIFNIKDLISYYSKYGHPNEVKGPNFENTKEILLGSNKNSDLHDLAGLEVEENKIEQLFNLNKPAWLTNENKLELYNHYIKQGNIKYAWLTLNSEGWLFSDARIAVAQMLNIIQDDVFNLQLSSWLEDNKEMIGGY